MTGRSAGRRDDLLQTLDVLQRIVSADDLGALVKQVELHPCYHLQCTRLDQLDGDALGAISQPDVHVAALRQVRRSGLKAD